MLKKFLLGALAGGTTACVYVQYKWDRFDKNYGQAQYVRAHQPYATHRAELGAHPVTYYSIGKLREEPLQEKPLTQHLTAVDVCVIGGGFAGLHTALALAEKGKRVVLLERRQIGCGASGRNGGDAIVGFHTPPDELAEIVGPQKAVKLYQQSVDGYNRLKHIIENYKIHCGMEEVGAITMAFNNRVQHNAGKPIRVQIDEEETFCAEQQSRFHEELEVWDPERVKQSGLRSDRYSYGIFNKRNMSLNPLELVLGLGRVCKKKGVQIYEASPVTAVYPPEHHGHRAHGEDKKHAKTFLGDKSQWLVVTPSGSVAASDVVLATASAPVSIAPELAVATVPLVTAMMLTKPIDKKLLDEVLSNKYAVFDERFALAYYRRVEGNRILYGSLCRGVPMNRVWAESKLIADLLTTFPSLRGRVTPEVSWQGRLDAKLPIFPMLGRTSKGLWYSLAYSGHGLVPTCAGGELLASAIASQHSEAPDTRYTLWNEVSHLPQTSWMLTHAPIGGPIGQLGAVFECYRLAAEDWFKKRY